MFCFALLNRLFLIIHLITLYRVIWYSPLFFNCSSTEPLDNKPLLRRAGYTTSEKIDCSYLCVLKGGLNISLIVDRYLRPIHRFMFVFLTKNLKMGRMAITIMTFSDFFTHDVGHIGGHYVTNALELWGELISRYRSTFSPSSQERKLIDVLLFQAFHERACSLPMLSKTNFIDFIDGIRGLAKASFYPNSSGPHIHADEGTKDFNHLIDEAAKLLIGAAQKHPLDTPSLSTDRKDRKER